MFAKLQHHIAVEMKRGHVSSRRDFLRFVGATGAALGSLSFSQQLALAADQLRAQGKSCILLWMAGGPSQFETFSPKPGHANGGETKAIGTAVSGIQISENLPETAKRMNDLAIIRSMTSKEGSHPRASFLLHHGYLPMGGVKFPTLGSHVAQQIGDAANDSPSFVRIGRGGQNLGNAGFLGVEFDPLVIQSASKPPENSRPMSTQDRYQRRLKLLEEMETDFGAEEGADIVANHRQLVQSASDMILSPKMEAFDLSQEKAETRASYGDSPFADGCLLARRLTEAGVTFVEVVSNGWDTHDDNFTRVKTLCGQVDRPMAALIQDLKERGRLQDTLVLWMGEFGRSPQINARSGRDHFPRAFNVALAGGGIKGGQVVGETNEAGLEVSSRPVSVNDLFQTIYTTLGIDPAFENMSKIGRPIKLVDGGEPVRELLS